MYNIIRFPHERTRAAQIDRAIARLELLHRFHQKTVAARRSFFSVVDVPQAGGQ